MQIFTSTPIDMRGYPVLFDEEYFRQNYGNYFRQNPRRKLRAYLSMIRQHMPGGRLLDIGCSYGLFVEEAGVFFECTGMDVDREIVAKAAFRVPAATFVTGALPGIPFHGMDVITVIDVLEHIPDPDSALASVRTALRPGGIALIVVPVYDGPLGRIARMLDRDPTHIHKRSRHYWYDLASRHLEVIEWRGFVRKLLFGKCYLNIQMSRLRNIAPAMAMVLQRT
jgi:SAM-dependent methyltransferase